MPTQEERITGLEQMAAEYRSILQNIAYELTMVKGLMVDQIGITQNLKQNMSDVNERLTHIEEQLNLMFKLTGPISLRFEISILAALIRITPPFCVYSIQYLSLFQYLLYEILHTTNTGETNSGSDFAS